MHAPVRAQPEQRAFAAQFISAAHRETATMLARASRIGDKAILGDLERQARFDQLDRLVRQVAERIRDAFAAIVAAAAAPAAEHAIRDQPVAAARAVLRILTAPRDRYNRRAAF